MNKNRENPDAQKDKENNQWKVGWNVKGELVWSLDL